MIVKELRIYPIKSCAAIEVKQALVTSYGLALVSDPRIYDRRWMVVRNGRHLSQRIYPQMALIKPQVTNNGLIIRAPNMSDLFISLERLPSEIMSCYCWDEPIFGLRYDQNVSQWFKSYLKSEEEIDLVVFDDEQFDGRSCRDKPTIPNEAHETDVAVYHDMCPIHLCSIESVDDLNNRLERAISIYNFRPNIIVENIDKPYSEDLWRDIRIGSVRFRWICPSLRCLLPTVDQQTGVKDPEQEPWKTLRTYRLKTNLFGTKALFGIYLARCEEEKSKFELIGVNDSIEVNQEDPHFWDR